MDNLILISLHIFKNIVNNINKLKFNREEYRETLVHVIKEVVMDF